jgi:hypothetical protein
VETRQTLSILQEGTLFMRAIPAKSVAAIALLSAVQAQAADATQQCLTRDEVHGMIAFVLPSAISSVAEKCTPVLPKDAFLLSRAPQLVSELEPARAAAFPMAKAAFMKFGGSTDKDTMKMMSALPEEALRPMIEMIVAEKVTGEIKPENCKDIDRIFSTIAPLPGANMIDLVTEALMIAGRKDDKMRSCPEA